MLAHKTVKTNPSSSIPIFWASLNGSGHPASWVAYHRCTMPYRYSEDISSPKQAVSVAHLAGFIKTQPADKKTLGA